MEVYHILKVNSITLIKEGGAKVYEKFAELLDKTNKQRIRYRKIQELVKTFFQIGRRAGAIQKLTS